MTGTVTYTNNGGHGQSNVAFNTGDATATINTQPSSSVTYTYEASVTCSGTKYYFVSATPASPFNSGADKSSTNVTAHYVSQYKVTFAQSGLNSDATGTVVNFSGTQNGSPVSGSLTASQLGTSSATIAFDGNTSVNYTYNTTVTSSISGEQYNLTTPAPSPASGFTVSSAVTITGSYKTQYKVTFDASANVKGDSTATIVTVGRSPKTAASLPFTIDFVDSGSSLTYSYASPVASSGSPSNTQYRWDSTSVLSQTFQSNTFTVSGPGTVTANYIAQYLLTLAVSSAIPGGNGNITGATSGVFYDSGTSLTLTAKTPVADGTGKQWRFDTWSGGATGSASPVTFSISSALTVTANYVAQYELTLAINPNPPLSLADISGGTSGSYYDSGNVLSLAVATPISAGAVGYVFSSWSGDATGSTNPVSVTMSAPRSVTANYNTLLLAWVAGQAFSAQYSDPTGLQAVLTVNGVVTSGRTIDFTVGTMGGTPVIGTTWSASTDTNGLAADTNPSSIPANRLTQAPGSAYMATASCSLANCGVALGISNPYTITQEDAQITYNGLQYFAATSTTATSMTVTVTYTLQDATASGTGNPIYDPWPGDITKATATVSLTGIAPTGSYGACTPNVVGTGQVGTNGLASTATITCAFTGVPVPGAYNLSITPGTGSYYTFTGDTSMAVTTANGGTGFFTGGGFQTATYLATPNTSVGKYTNYGFLAPATGTKMNFGFEAISKKNTKLQGGVNLIIRSKPLTNIAGYKGTPGDDGLCVYQIKVSQGQLQAASENLSTTSQSYAQLTGSANIQDVTGPNPVSVAGNLSLILQMYDVGDPGANVDTLAIQLTDNIYGTWLSSNWTGTKTVISNTAPVINGGNLQVH